MVQSSFRTSPRSKGEIKPVFTRSSVKVSSYLHREDAWFKLNGVININKTRVSQKKDEIQKRKQLQRKYTIKFEETDQQ